MNKYYNINAKVGLSVTLYLTYVQAKLLVSIFNYNSHRDIGLVGGFADI